MNELEKLGLKYGTDKIGKHNYLPVYYDLFKDKRNEVKKVLEIGVAEGASLFMWRDFFPNAKIYGGELDQDRVDLLKDQNRIEVIKFDQGSVKDLNNLVDNILLDIDLIVDDGSHVPSDQLFTCLGIMPFVSKNTIYIIEDVVEPGIKNFITKYDAEVIEVGKRYDDRLIIVRNYE